MRLPLIALVCLALCPFASAGASDPSDDVTWTMCTTGAFRMCSSAQVRTMMVECNSALCFPEIGMPATRVIVTLRNLQGSDARDNSFSSILEGWQLRFRSAAQIGFLASSPGNQAAMLEGAVGTDYGTMVREFGWTDNRVFLEENAAWPTVLFGCNTSPFSGSTPFVGGRFGLQTCDPLGFTGAVSFSAQFTGDFRASDLESVVVQGFAFETGEDADATLLRCDTATPGCEVFVTPEPGTMTLVATGLIAVAAAVRRRRARASRPTIAR